MTSTTPNSRRRAVLSRAFRRRGATFVEVLLVVTIIALAAGMVLPAVARGYRGEKWREARAGVVGLLHHAMKRSGSEARELHVSFDETRHAFILARSHAGGMRSGPRDAILRLAYPEYDRHGSGSDESDAQSLATPLSIVRIERSVRVTTDGLPIRFSTAGWISEGKISLQSDRGERFELDVPGDLGGVTGASR